MSQPKNQAARHIMIYSIGTILRQLVGFIMLPIYTSYLTPTDYGIVSLLAISVAIFELVLGARFAQVIPRFYYDEQSEKARKTVLSTALTVTALFSIVGVIAIWLGKGPLASILFGSYDYSIYIGIYALLLFTNGIETYGLMYLRILERPVAFITVSLVKLFFQLSLNIYFIVFLDYGVMGVILSGVISSSLFCLLFLFLIYGRCGLKFDKSLLKQLIIFSWPIWLAGGAAIYIQSSNRFFIRIFSSLNDVGLFELATRFAMILPLLIWQPFGNWWQTQKFRIVKESTNMQKEMQQIFDLIATVMVLATVGIVLFTDPVIVIMSSAEFHSASSIILPLTLSFLFVNLSVFFNLSFLVEKKTIIIAYLKYSSALIMTMLYLILIPPLGLMGASCALLISNILLFNATYFWAKKHFDLGVNLNYFSIITFIAIIFGLIDLYSIEYSSLYEKIMWKSLFMIVFSAIVVVSLAKNKATSFLVRSAINKISKRFT